MLKFCTNCVMDGSDPDLVLDDQGICNHCYQARKALKEAKDEKHNLGKWIEKIKSDSNEYDCLIGLSGGADSSTVLHNAIKLGLKPLCFSVDNGWNDSKADENIMRMVEKLKVPFFRYTINLKRFKELQGAFMRSGVKNIEIPTDHILMAVSLELAEQNNIKWILSGGNVASESIMPASWGYNARDLVHIKDIYQKMTGKELTGLPLCGLLKWNWYKWVKGIKTFYLLDYLDYKLKESKEILKKEYGWQDYHEKHCESIFTWWFQNFYLFEKFGIDKRKAHLSSLINSGQMTRSEALEILAKSPEYPKLGIEQRVLRYPKHKHEDYKMDKWFDRISNFIKLWR